MSSRPLISSAIALPKIDSYFIFLLPLPNPLLQELPLWFLLGQRQSFLIRGPSLSCPAEPAVHIRSDNNTVRVAHDSIKPGATAPGSQSGRTDRTRGAGDSLYARC